MKIRPFYLKSAFKVAFAFFILSFLWILFSDRLLFYLFKDAYQLTYFQTIKGWFYVFVATIAVFYLVNREINKKNKLLLLVNKKNEWYKLLLSNIQGIEVLLFDENAGYIMAHGNNIVLTEKMLSKNIIDEKLNFQIENQKVKFRELKERILKGEKLHYETVSGENFIDLVGQPITDDENKIIAGLFVIHDTTHHKRVLQELKDEKKNYETLFREYHAINLELKHSYEKLQKNISLLNDSKERYKAFLMQTTEAVYRIDFKETIDDFIPQSNQINLILKNAYIAESNPVFAEIYGYSNLSKLQGMKLSDLKQFDADKHFEILIRELVANKFVLRNFETRETTDNKLERYFLNNLIGIIENNKILRLWGIKTDITKLKKYERELIFAKQAAENSDKLKSAFLANMSHEVRTPLNGIIGFSELLCQDSLSEEQKKKYVTVVKTSNTQLLRIIDDILDISRIETGQLSISRELFHLNVLINELESFLRQEINKRHKNLEISVQKMLDDDQDFFYTDKQRLYQVLSNLLNNAVKFTDAGQIEFGYSVNYNKTIEFFVKDSGIGIPASEHESIFKQFKQVEEYTSRKYGGTGLGLSISKGIVELLGGKISLQSEINKGSVFRFVLPLITEKK